MGRPVIVSGLDGDNGKHILVVVCLEPPEAYCNKDQKHVGFIRGGKVVPDKKAEPLSEREHTLVMRHYFGLRAALTNLYENSHGQTQAEAQGKESS